MKAFKLIIAGLLALTGAYFILKLVWWVIGVAFTLLWFAVGIGALALVTIPLFLFIKKKLLK